MTFEEILDQAIAMLQGRGRLTYGHPRQGTSIALADRLDSADTHALRCATAAQLDTSKIEE